MNLTAKNYLVTGAGVRVGATIARRLAGAGAGVVIHYRTSERAALDLRDSLIAEGHSAWAVQGELTGEAACRRVMADAVSAAGSLDGLINNASSFHKHTFPEIQEDTLLGEFSINLFAPIYLTRAFADCGRDGVVVNLLDRRIEANDPSCIPYSLSKKALADFTRAAALALAPRIRLGGVCPGPVLPPPGEGLSYLADHAGTVPLASYPTPDQIADAVLYLIRQEGSTGQVLYVDGGQHLLGNGV